jgi:hypothetical protein
VKYDTFLQFVLSQAWTAPVCNPSYSGGRDQEDHSSKSDPANRLKDPISKIPNTKKGLAEGLKC